MNMKRNSARLHLEQLEDRTLLSSPGDVEWLRQFGTFRATDQPDPARSVVANGSVYVAGDIPGFYGPALPGQISSGGLDDAYVRKYDATGAELWSRQFGAGGQSSVSSLAADSSGVYLAGYADNPLPGQTTAGAFVRKYDPDGNELWTHQFDGYANSIAVDSSGVYVAGSAGPDASVRKYDPDGNELWIRQFGTNSFDTAIGIAVDSSGIYVGGETGGTFTGQISAGGIDAFVRKYDIGGNEIWTRQFGTTGRDQVSGVAVNASGVYVTGFTEGTLPGQISVGNTDAFVRKYDASGNVVWTRQFGSAPYAVASGVTADASGVFVAGATEGALPGQTNAGNLDAYVRKYDANGNELWTRQFGTDGNDFAFGVAVDASGVFVAGQTFGTFPDQTAYGGEESYVRRYDTGGTEVWTREFTGLIRGQDFAQAVDADGNVYVAGYLDGPLPGSPITGGAFLRKYDAAGNELWTRQFAFGRFDWALALAIDGPDVYVSGFIFQGVLPGQSSPGYFDAFVRKYDGDGNEIWTSQFGTDFEDAATALAVNGSAVYVAGYTQSDLPGQTFAGGDDAFVRKYDTAGTVLWTRQFGTSGSDRVTGIAADASGVYLSGFTGAFTAGGQDAFVRRYDADGNVVWTSQFGSAATDSATGIAMDASGVYVSGFTSGALAGQTSSGSDDAFLLKYDATGTVLWTRQFGSAGMDQATAVAVGPSGVYVAGFTDGALPGQTSAGDQDAFIRKFDIDGGVLWTGQFGTPGADQAAGVAISTSGLFVAGFTTGSFTGEAIDPNSLINWDAFVAKIQDNVGNSPPSNLILTPSAASINENSSATLNGSFTDPDTADAHTVVIDWGSGEGSTTLNLAPGVTTFSASHLYLNDNPAGTPSDIYSIDVTVSDASASTSASTALTVNNLPPSAAISGPSSALVGDSLIFTLSAADPSPVDQGAGFIFSIDWDGNGVVDEMVTGPSGMTIRHTYATPGLYNPSVTAEDQDGGVSDVALTSVNVLTPPTIEGLVWVDFNNDGQVDFGETVIPGVTITLTGTDDLGNSVSRTTQTDANGVYLFINLRPSDAAGYTIAETQPAGFVDGRDTLGSVNGVPTGSNSANDVFSGVVVSQGGSVAENYNFGERPTTNGAVAAGQTATIGYWQNRNGQSLIMALNGGSSATQLGHWLASTFPNMYGALDGMTNAQIAAYYKALFARTINTNGPPKVDAQVLATALAVYVTDQTLAGTTAVAYGFQVSATGVGTRTFNVGNNGAPFGVANNSSLSVMDLLLAVDARSHNGLLYDQNGDGHISSDEASFRTMANNVFTGINEAGDI